MKSTQVMGLGEPEPFGKKSLFQPPTPERVPSAPTPAVQSKKKEKTPPVLGKRSNGSERLRMTLEITQKSLSIIKETQHRYRLATGHALPKWKIISEALELYEKSKAGEGSEHAKPAAGQ